ncbi:hypothetical protein Hamer_G020936 [Homarus americanus]|uniref:Secreted protein n=1 Tax=Homarus americanus TaxID=6706 RepID=A0A8J5K2J6_HOMAM|nr:hypothetical protein Hamer_G020936 [Homarus americanus]
MVCPLLLPAPLLLLFALKLYLARCNFFIISPSESTCSHKRAGRRGGSERLGLSVAMMPPTATDMGRGSYTGIPHTAHLGPLLLLVATDRWVIFGQ